VVGIHPVAAGGHVVAVDADEVVGGEVESHRLAWRGRGSGPRFWWWVRCRGKAINGGEGVCGCHAAGGPDGLGRGAVGGAGVMSEPGARRWCVVGVSAGQAGMGGGWRDASARR